MPKRLSKRARHKRRQNHLLATITYQGEVDIPTQVELIQYNDASLSVKSILRKGNLHKEKEGDKINWFKTIGLSDVDYINEICRSCGLHGFDIRDIMSGQEVVKVVVYDKVTFILMPAFTFNESNDFDVFQVGFILGEDFVISLQESPMPIFDDIIKALNDPAINIRLNSSDFLLYILLNAVNSLNLNTILKIEDQLLDIEDLLIAKDDITDIMTRLRGYRISYIKMKRSLLSIREEYNNLQRNTNRLIRDKNIIYFNDFDDKLRTTLSDLETCHELLSSLLDMHYSNTNLRMNEIMKRLTIVSTIFIPLTFMVGVWGMNFKVMPELEWEYGYFLAWGSFLIIVIIVLRIMKKKNWF